MDQLTREEESPGDGLDVKHQGKQDWFCKDLRNIAKKKGKLI